MSKAIGEGTEQSSESHSIVTNIPSGPPPARRLRNVAASILRRKLDRARPCHDDS